MSSPFSTSPSGPAAPAPFWVAAGDKMPVAAPRSFLSPTAPLPPSDAFDTTPTSDGFTVSGDSCISPPPPPPPLQPPVRLVGPSTSVTDGRGGPARGPPPRLSSAYTAAAAAAEAVGGGSHLTGRTPPYPFAHGIVAGRGSGLGRLSRDQRVHAAGEDGLGFRAGAGGHTDPHRPSASVPTPEYATVVAGAGVRGPGRASGGAHHFGAPGNPQRLHQDFKALSKEERRRLVEQEAAAGDLLARTVHLRFLPTTMLQSELARICAECGPYLRVRICGNSTNNQNWIYGFVEFATREGAANMMKKCGMELNNGPGRPPLRLKCNCAKQPIVDRVFHDADPATNAPCIFGLGNFAHRSIKDALDSYFNLKEKEAAMGSAGGADLLPPPPPMPGPRDVLTAPSATPKLSPHATAFHPNPDAAAFTPGSLGLSLAGQVTPELRSTGAASAGLTRPSLCTRVPSSPASTATSEWSDAAGGAGGVGGQSVGSTGGKQPPPPPPAPLPTSAWLGGPAAPATPSLSPSPLTSGSPPTNLQPPLFTVAYGGRQLSDWSLGGTSPTPTFTTAAVALTGVAGTPGTDGLGVNGMAGQTMLDPLVFGSLAESPAALAGMHAGSDRDQLVSGGSGYPCAMASMVGGLVLPTTAGPETTTEAAANQLTQALQAMMESSDLHTQRRVCEAEELLLRARSLLATAMGQATRYAESDARAGFFDAIGTLRALLELLERNAAVFETATSRLGAQAMTGAVVPDVYLASEGERGRRRLRQLAQWATQLRLLANLLSAMLYMRRRSFVDALPFIHAVVTLTNAIPSCPLPRPSSTVVATAQTAGPTSPVGAPGTHNAARHAKSPATAAVEREAMFPTMNVAAHVSPVSSRGGDSPIAAMAPLGEAAAAVTTAATPVSATGVAGVQPDSLFSFFDGASAELLKAVLAPLSEDDEEDHLSAGEWTVAPATAFSASTTAGVQPPAFTAVRGFSQDPKASTSAGTVLRADSQRETPDGERASVSSGASGAWAGRAGVRRAGVDEAYVSHDARFHCFVLNVLVTVGLALEEVQPVVTRSTYALAAGRARDILGQQCEALDACLRCDSEDDDDEADAGVGAAAHDNERDRHMCTQHASGKVGSASVAWVEPRSSLLSARIPGLTSQLAEEAARLGGSKDITTLPSLFLRSMPVVDEERSIDDESAWAALPPQHMVSLFSV